MRAEFSGERGRHARGHTYIPGIDGLRAAAVLSVLVYHINSSMLPGGFVGVDIFFVISGFVVALATSNISARELSGMLLSFYRRRVVRILPAALVFIVVTTILSMLFVPVTASLTVSDMTAISAIGGMANILLWLKSGDYFSTGSELNPFTHSWSLGVEEQFYFIFPFIAFYLWISRGTLSKYAALLLVSISISSLFVAAYATWHHPIFAFYMIPSRFWELAAGVLLYVAIGKISRGGNTVASGRSSIAVGIMGMILLLAGFAFVDSQDFPFPGAIIPVFAAVALIYSVTSSPDCALSKFFSLSPLRYVGRISYSLYLWHWPVVVLMRWTTGLDTSVKQILAALASWAMADLSYRLVERPARNSPWLARRSDGKVILGALAAMAATGGIVGGTILLRPTLSLSVTRDAEIWLGSTLVTDGRCGVVRNKDTPAAGVTRYRFKPASCQGVGRGRRMYVVGDSHAWAYQRLLSRVTETLGIPVTVYMSPGCPVVPGYVQDNDATSRCNDFTRFALAAVRDEIHAGDVLFLPGLRIPRYREYWETIPGSRPAAQLYSPAMLYRQLTILQPVLATGARIVFEAPKPVYRQASLRCSDWFNGGNPHCRTPPVSRAEAQADRAPVLSVFHRLQAAEPQIELWDPFPILCPGTECQTMLKGGPLAPDGDHPGGHANDLLFSDFVRHLERDAVSATPRKP